MEHTKESEERGRILVMLRSHVERCLQDIWESPELITDPDADYPYRYGTAACWVSILDGPELGVRVFAHAAVGVRPSAKLAREVNELNDNAVWVKVVLAGAAGGGVGGAALVGGGPDRPGAGGSPGRRGCR